jgi:hypothetical protein
MTTELWAALIGAVVLLLTNTAAAIKMWADIAKTKADRAEVGAKRDADSQTLHDQVQKLTWENARLREDMQFMKTGLGDHATQLNVFNAEMAKVSTKLDNALEILRDLKEAK